MLGISGYEFLVVLLISFIFLKPADLRKIIIAIRDILNFINSFVRDVTTTVEKSIALDDFKMDDFFVIDKTSKKEKVIVNINENKLEDKTDSKEISIKQDNSNSEDSKEELKKK